MEKTQTPLSLQSTLDHALGPRASQERERDSGGPSLFPRAQVQGMDSRQEARQLALAPFPGLQTPVAKPPRQAWS